jgi:transmembrane protein DUF3566
METDHVPVIAEASRASGLPGSALDGSSSPDHLGQDPVTRTIVVDKGPVATAEAAAPPSGSTRFRVARVGPWSVLKHALIFSTGTLVVVLAGLAVLYFVLDAVGVLRSIQHLVNSAGVGHRFRFDASWIFTRLVWVGAFMVMVGSLVATCLAVFYNAASEVTGGLDVSLEPVDGGGNRLARSEGRRARTRPGAWRPIAVGTALARGTEGNGEGERLPDASGF